jgi:hypothetical protein
MDLQLKDQRFEAEQKRLLSNESALHSSGEEAQSKIIALQKELKEARKREDSAFETAKKEVEATLENLREKIEDTERALQQKDEKVR